MLLLVCALLAPVDVRAARLETDGERWQADEVELRRGDLTVRASRASGGPSAGCLADITLQGPVALDLTGGRMAAGQATLCVREGSVAIEADDVRATACRCDHPPWHVTASRATAIAGRGAWVAWPVLWAGPVPVAAAPAWYVPFARRRTGLLLPELGWHGEDGPWGRLPLFVTLGQSADLTVAGGYRHGHGADGRARLRWAASERDGGRLGASLVGDEWVVDGRGTAPLGPVRFAVDGALTGDPAAWQTVHPLFADQRDHLRGAAGAAATGAWLGGGVRAVGLQDLRHGEPPFTFADGDQVFPEAWLAWTSPVGPAAITIDARALELVAFEALDTQLFDLAAGGEATFWLGPMRLRPVAGLATTVHTLEDRSGQRLSGFVGADLEIAVGRGFAGGVHHGVHLVVDTRYAEAEVVDAAPNVRVPADRARASRGAGLTLSNRARGPRWSTRVDVRGGYEGRAPVEGYESLSVRAVVDRPESGLEGDAYGTDAVYVRARVGAVDGARLVGGLGRLNPDAETGWFRSVGPRRSLGWAFDPLASATTVEARGALPLGPMHLEYGAWLDAEDGQLLAQDGRLAYGGACDCWRAELRASHLRGRDAPDVWLSVALGAGP